jgi:hypothetical protein
MYQAEALQRQGSWVKKFEEYYDAKEWLIGVIDNHQHSKNPVRAYQIIDLTKRPKLRPPRAPKKTFDEAWK